MTNLTHIITSWTLEELTEERINVHLALKFKRKEPVRDYDALEELEKMRKELAIIDAEIGYRITTEKPISLPDHPYDNEVPF